MGSNLAGISDLMADQQRIIEVFSEMAPEYEQKVDNELRRFWGISYQHVIGQMMKLTEICRTDRILDLATGTSALPIELFRDGKRPASVTGLDITYPMLANGKEKIHSIHPGAPIHLTCGSALALPFRDASYDIILCGFAAHHLNVESLLSESYRVLRPGGRITVADVGRSKILSLPGVDRVVASLAFLYFTIVESPKRAQIEASSLPHIYTAAEWTSHFTNAGFCNVEAIALQTGNHWSPEPLILKGQKILTGN